MDIVLHIGTQKTGTTTFQQTFIQQSDILARHSVYYPTFSSVTTQLELGARYYGKDFDEIVSRLTTLPKEDVLTLGDRLWNKISRHVERTKPALMVLSFETFWRMEHKKAFLDDLRDRFPKANVRIVAYLREPVGFFISLTQQRLKWRTDVRAPFTLGFGPHLAEWADLAPLTIRHFDRKALIDGDVAADALAHLLQGRVPMEELEFKRRNESLSTESCALIGEILTYAYDEDGRTERRDRANAARMLKSLERQMPESHPVRKLTLRPGVAEQVLSAAKPDLILLRDRLNFTFPDIDIDALPDPVGADQAIWLPFADLFEVDPENVARFRAVALRGLMRNVSHLRKQRRSKS